MSSRSSSSSAERHRRPCHRHHHRHRRRHHHDHSRSSSDEWGPLAAISCAPPLHRLLESKIQRGKYVKFDHLLLPSDTSPTAGPAPSRTHGRRARELCSVVDFTSWTEAWNRYLCMHLAAHPQLTLELAKYQTILDMLFSQYPASHCLRYDRLFRQAAAHDPTLRWDELKEDVYVWCFTCHASPHRPTDRWAVLS